jgi:putative FmdB family regulatory protein
MPTYDYKCAACGHQFERFQSIKAAPVKKCPECGKNKVNRLISAGAGLIFKGSGFYITDYRDSSYKEQAKAESGSAGASGDASSNGKAETKAEGTAAATGSDSSGKSSAAGASDAPAKSESKSKSASKSESPKAKK